MSSPARVLLLTDLLEVGGAEMQLVDLIRAFDEQGMAADLAILRKDGALVPRLTRAPIFLPKRFPFDPGPWFALRALTARLSTEIIVTTHVWSLLYATLLRLSPRGRRVRIVATVHSYRQPGASPLLEPLWRAALRRADLVIAVSRLQGEWLVDDLGIQRSRLVVLPNGLDLTKFDPATIPKSIAIEGRVVVCVARLVPEKNHAVLLEAFGRLAKQSEAPTTLVLIGDGPLRADLERRARALISDAHLPPDSIRFLGTVADPRPWLVRADAVVLASASESQGIALLEAMALGRPVVATRVGGIPEVIADRVNGRLVSPGAPEELAAAMAELLNDATLAANLGNAGADSIRLDYSIQARAQAFARIFATLRTTLRAG